MFAFASLFRLMFSYTDYDLVRHYHPDKVGASLTPEVAQARFQSISAAYDVLRGKTLLIESGLGGPRTSNSSASYQTTAAYRAMQRRRQELYDTGAVDDGRKDAWIIFGVVMVCPAPEFHKLFC